MANDNKLENAMLAYRTICSALDARDWKYKEDTDKLLVNFGVNGEDLPMEFIIFADADRQLIRLMSLLPFKMSEAKRMEGAIATGAVNWKLADGSFSYDLFDGTIVFKMAASFQESTIGVGLIQYMISCACAIVDEYNDKFLAIDKGVLSIQDFLKDE